METAILIVAYNRETMFEKLIQRLSQIKPKHLLVFFDGPKDNNIDLKKVFKTRNLLSIINWECDLKVSKQSKNLGCGVAVTTAITWGFEFHESLIILEDDVFPSVSFFTFMSESLDKFKDDSHILGVGGFNRILNKNFLSEAENTYLTNYPMVWGWGTWKDRWSTYNFEIFNYRLNYPAIFSRNNYNLFMVLYFLYNFKKISRKKLDTWDYQLTYLAFISKKFFVLPSVNLVENIGMNMNSTHTSKKITYPYAAELESIVLSIPHYKKILDKTYRKYRRRDFQEFFIIFLISKLKYCFSSTK